MRDLPGLLMAFATGTLVLGVAAALQADGLASLAGIGSQRW